MHVAFFWNGGPSPPTSSNLADSGPNLAEKVPINPVPNPPDESQMMSGLSQFWAKLALRFESAIVRTGFHQIRAAFGQIWAEF